MVIDTDLLKETSNKILAAVDSDGLSEITEALELDAHNYTLFMNVTNKEYHVQVRIPIASDELLNATVNANLFLKLISQITTPDIELKIVGNSLELKGNGVYNIPIIYSNEDEILELPVIGINNITCTMNISSDVLQSISKYNSKELKKSGIKLPVQKMYYMDDQGAITFGTGACVNEFKLEKPVKLLLTNKIVKLFKLFGKEDVLFTLGQDLDEENNIQTKVKFESSNVTLSSYLNCEDSLLRSIPVTSIRKVANEQYNYNIQLNKNALLQALNRLELFSEKSVKDEIRSYCIFEFHPTCMIIYDKNKKNSEKLDYLNDKSGITEEVTYKYDLLDFKYTLENYTEDYFNMSFGGNAAVLTYNNIKNIIACVQSFRGN